MCSRELEHRTVRGCLGLYLPLMSWTWLVIAARDMVITKGHSAYKRYISTQDCYLFRKSIWWLYSSSQDITWCTKPSTDQFRVFMEPTNLDKYGPLIVISFVGMSIGSKASLTRIKAINGSNGWSCSYSLDKRGGAVKQITLCVVPMGERQLDNRRFPRVSSWFLHSRELNLAHERKVTLE